MLNKQQLERIAKEAVVQLGEVDRIGNSLGNCSKISQLILNRLVDLNYKIPEEASILTPSFREKDGGFSTGMHVAVVLPRQKLIIDTQVWQYTVKRIVGLNGRKVVFTYNEYKEKGFMW